VCDLETSRMGAPYIYDISRLRVKHYSYIMCVGCHYFLSKTHQIHFTVPNVGHRIHCYLQLQICCKTLFEYAVKLSSNMLYNAIPHCSHCYGDPSQINVKNKNK